MKKIKSSSKLALLALFLLHFCGESEGAAMAGSLTSYNDEDVDRVISQNGDAGDFSGADQVIRTVVNINDSNASALLNNFNVSLDEIRRRILAPMPAATDPTVDATSSEDNGTTDDSRRK